MYTYIYVCVSVCVCVRHINIHHESHPPQLHCIPQLGPKTTHRRDPWRARCPGNPPQSEPPGAGKILSGDMNSFLEKPCMTNC